MGNPESKKGGHEEFKKIRDGPTDNNVVLIT